MLDLIKNTGDWDQVEELSHIWNFLFQEKEQFINRAMQVNLSPYQAAEIELSIAMITGKMKAVDAKIHYLMFGEEIVPEEISKPLIWHSQKQYREEFVELRMEVSRLKKDKAELHEKCSRLTSYNGWIKWELKKMNVDLKKPTQLELQEF
jgi:hypothetical protein